MSANGSVEIAADAVLSSGLISSPIGAETVAVLFSSAPDGYWPPARSSGSVALTSIVTGAWVGVMVPRLHVVPVQVPCDGVIDWTVRAGSMASVSWTLAALAMPLLVTVMR